ncbi:mast cell protease 1A-like [Parambassis ranga]|uniref:Mast cell protease 1A-like n=1 Tax=Parambassis ranga TaxID=210632 RepID=A0A6P7I7L7_9TELE|nr:mast cell protease 1A-like [Parambassis ranga]
MHTLHTYLLFHVLFCLGQKVHGHDIINGKKAKKNSMQYMAHLTGRGGCGGFLVSEDFVMSAAHCAGLTEVTLGTHNLNKIDRNTMIYSVEKQCQHPNYDNNTLSNDIMLLKLSRKAQMGKKKIKPVKLPSKNPKPLKAKQKCTVAGWGLTKTAGNSADELQVVDVPVIDLKECKNLWGRSLPPEVICAGGYNTPKGICQGDSGGPLVCKGVAVGVVSFNNKSNCDYPDLPNVYTDISKFLPWINDILKKKKC